MKFNYQSQANLAGIYKILNTHTNRIYVGQCSSFKKRWYQHAISLLKENHQNKFLLNDFKKCFEALGHDDFLEFHVLEVMEGSSKEERNQREEAWIKEVYSSTLPDGSRACYNFKEKSEGKERTIYSHTPEATRLKKSSSMKRVWENEEFREAISAKAKVFWNTPEGKANASERANQLWSDPVHQEKMSELLKTRMANEEVRSVRTASLNSEKSIGKRSETYRKRLELEPKFLEKMQAHGRKNIAIRNANQTVKTYGSIQAPDGTIYHNISHVPTFAKEHGLQKQNLYSLLTGKVKSHKGWRLFIL